MKTVRDRLSQRVPVLTTATSLVVALATPFAAAQSAPADASPEDVVTLSPFTINTEKDIGYLATSTLSGTRTNTALKDVANPLDIFTAELMSDLGVQDIQDLTNFANGVEANAAGGFNSDGQEREVWNYNYMQIRGFKTGVLTRNFMDLNAQFEAYNSERVEFSKGPNAILSGSGNPGGTVNYATKTPRLARNAYSVEHRTDDLGSQRVSTDLNQVIIPQKLGIRLNALWEDQEFYRQPSYERQEAWHLTGTWAPTRDTEITVGHERRESERASPRGIFPTDYVTAWLDAGSPIVTRVPSNNNVTVNGANTTAASQGLTTVNGDNWVLDSDGIIRNTRSTARGTFTRINGQTGDTVAFGLDYPIDTWIGGPNGINDSDWDISEVNITHRVNEDFNIELAYGHTENDIRQGMSVDRRLFVDPNDFGANTHAGELYMETRPFWIDRNIEIDHYRATASYDLPFDDFNEWFGTHQLAFAYEYNERDEAWNGGRLTLVETPSGLINPASYANGYQTGSLAFYTREYLDPAAGRTSHRDLRDLYYSDGINMNGYVAKFLPITDYATSRTLSEQDSLLGVLQSRWLKDHLITTIGLRKDKRRVYDAEFQNDGTGLYEPVELVEGAPAGTKLSNYAAFTNPPSVVEGISRNYGAVIHALDWLSFTANYATNFSPRTESRDLYGNYVPASSGESTDFGIRLDLLEGRMSINLVHYETEELGSATNGNSINSPFQDMRSADEILADNGIIPEVRLFEGFTTADRRAKGQELTIIGNPTRNWTIRLSASSLENKQTNLAPDVRAFYLENLPFYQSQDQSLTRTNGTTTLGTYVQDMQAEYALMNTRENVQVFPASKYSASGTAKYTFDRASALKGLAAGGTVRWSSAPIIGYFLQENGSFDINRYTRGDERFNTDIFVSYQRRLVRGIEWKIQLNISNLLDEDDPYPINARNVSSAADSAWAYTTYRPQDGRVIALTNSFTF